MNEWGFASEVSKWWDDECARHPEWRLSSVRVEEVVPGTRLRSDLLVLGDRPVLCGELRLPDHPQSAPWDIINLQDAVNKAISRGSRWAFTSDANVLLLIDVQREGPIITRIVHQVELEHFERRTELDSAVFLERIQASWRAALQDIAPIVTGLARAPGMAPDELFINAMRALLSAPASAIRDAINQRRIADRGFEQSLVEWMVDDQGWAHDPAKWESEILLAARLTTYVFATRLLFYEALRRSQPLLRRLDLPAGAPASVGAATLGAYFQDARDQSGDYATLFVWDRVSEYAMVSDASAHLWARVIQHIGDFDVSRIGYDILGRLFERLIEPSERYRWGQHYTMPDVVDLMLSFAIPDGGGAVLDPAVGGGTFLVRAYVRKVVLTPGRTHQELLSELYGIDVSGFAATIATVNLAVRQLDFTDNYPRVAPRSFFRVEPGVAVLQIPGPPNVSLSGRALHPVSIERVQAVVTNPPYIRLHELGEERQREAKRVLNRTGGVTTPRSLHGLSNYHVYFWLHGAQFLKPGGRLALITAGEWMDSDYGAGLQEWLLNHFCIEACIESAKEAWFSEARVGTVVTIARLCPDEAERLAHQVRFVWLRRTLRELYGGVSSDGEDPSHIMAVDALRDRLLALTGEGEGADFNWSVVSQRQLLALGSRLMTAV